MKRAHNFFAGPAILPQEVLEEASQGVKDLNGIGMSVLEISHRSKFFEDIINQAKEDIKELLNLPDNYEVLFLQGGASHQFAMIPYNFLVKGKKANYVLTGSWSKKALKEASILGETYVSATSEDTSFDRIPASIDISDDSCYLHITSNNTIFGTQWANYPDTGNVPLICDMSSDIFCRPIDVKKFALIYAGAQKNAGPAGATIVIIRKDLLENQNSNLNTLWNYETHIKKNSMFNTPPVFAVYVIGLVAKWLKKQGGLEKIYGINKEKAGLIYNLIDKYPDFFKGHAKENSRSLMNITMRLPNEDLEKLFVEEASKNDMYGLKGHREVGGLRASMYNALPMESAKALAEFMEDFYKRHG